MTKLSPVKSTLAALVAGAVAGLIAGVVALEGVMHLLSANSAETDTLGLFIAAPAGLLTMFVVGVVTFVFTRRALKRP